MKTTNKILIGLAVALFVFPVGGMVIWAKSNRIDQKVYNQEVESEKNDFNTKDKYMVATKVNAFDKVSISSNENAYVSLFLIKSDVYGFKVSKGLEDKFTHQIDDHGRLFIKTKHDEKFFQGSVYIFAPTFDDIELATIQLHEIGSNLDSLRLTLKNVNSLKMFGENKNLKSLYMVLDSSDAGFLTKSDSEQVQNLDKLTLKMKNSSFSLGKQVYNKVIASLDNSSLIYMTENNSKQLYIKDLSVTTLGSSTLGSFNKDQIGNLSGRISDSTTVMMPLYMYKDIVVK